MLSTAAALLASLTNPLNVTLLTAQLLNAPALWARPEGLRFCRRFMSVFSSAAATVLHEDHRSERDKPPHPNGPPTRKLSLDTWIKAVVKGADERSSPWKHPLVLGGLLIGLRNAHEDWVQKQQALLRPAFVQAVNSALADLQEVDELGTYSITLGVNDVFPLIHDEDRIRVEYDLLLPILTRTTFFSPEGFQSAYFLSMIELDLAEVEGKKLSWPAQSASFNNIDRLASLPLMTSIGPLARLIAHSVAYTNNPWKVQKLVEQLTGFSRSLLTQWRQNKLSSFDASHESTYLDQESLEKTVPRLWKVLRSALFTVTTILQGVIGRLLGDRMLAADAGMCLGAFTIDG